MIALLNRSLLLLILITYCLWKQCKFYSNVKQGKPQTSNKLFNFDKKIFVLLIKFAKVIASAHLTS